jgi:hypothetical protein
MTDPTAFSQEIQGQLLDTIRKSQDAITDAVKTWAEAVHSVTPSVPVPPVPFADRLPKPADLVANAYDFAEQLLASQRKFAEDILQATAPVLTPKDGSAPKKPAAKASTAA